MVDFRFRLVEDTYVVWVAGINRYIQLKEPAFRVFEQWARDIDKNDIANSCSSEYTLPYDESIRFVEEITGQIQMLFDALKLDSGVLPEITDPNQNTEYFSEHTYQIGGHEFRFIYRNEYLENLFHPLFCHQETEISPTNYTAFELFSNGNQDAFKVNDSAVHSFPVEEIDNFQGAVCMELLNVIHHMSTDEWMGVIHASAVTDGKGAVIFTAPSGSGKSSIALLMMMEGFNILSDDFVPIALHKPEIHHFPAGISVKKSGIPFLNEYIPQIFTKSHESNETEIYLPPPTGTGLLTNVTSKAIVFVNYDPETEYDLKRESNLEVMNHLIKQTWIAGTPEAAERFLDWYFNLPVYTLRYFNNKKAVEGIRELFDCEDCKMKSEEFKSHFKLTKMEFTGLLLEEKVPNGRMR